MSFNMKGDEIDRAHPYAIDKKADRWTGIKNRHSLIRFWKNEASSTGGKEGMWGKNSKNKRIFDRKQYGAENQVIR